MKTSRWKQTKVKKIGRMAETMENERYAKMLNVPEEYYKIWGKKSIPSVRGHEETNSSKTRSSLPTNQENQETEAQKLSFWKQPTLYWGLAGGVGICLLGMGIYWLMRNKR
jgi:hypothetical protein